MTASQNTKEKETPYPPAPATQCQKFWLVCIHFLLSSLVIVGIFLSIVHINKEAALKASTKWGIPQGAILDIGPSTFTYSPAEKTLYSHGPIDDKKMLELRGLLKLPPNHKDNPPASITENNRLIHIYHHALDSLSDSSKKMQENVIYLLLLIGTLGGLLGAILRSLVDFIGHACYTGRLDLTHWWPLYATRPIIGAILGFILVVLIKARLISSPDIETGLESFWWLGIAVLGGFSTVDVTQRLRLAAKAIFGNSNEKNQ